MILSMLVLAASCQNKKDKLLSEIQKLESQDTSASPAGMKELAGKFAEFAEAYPEDPKSPLYLHKAAIYSYLMEDYESSLDLSKKYLSRYANGKEWQPTVVNVARTFGRGLNQPDSALIYYDLFSEKGELSVADQVDLAAVYSTLGDKANDSLSSPTYWFKAAGALSGAGAFEGAIIEYLKIADKFPKDAKAPNALFTTAFLYENELGNNEKALEYYKRVAKEFPDNPMGQNAKLLLSKNLVGKTADEIAESWER